MAMIPKDEEKMVVHTLLQNNKFSFAYHISNNVTNPDEFLSSGYDIDIFKPDTKVAVKM